MDNTAHLLQYEGSGGTVIGTMVQPTNCTNQAVTAVPSTGVPTCSTITSAFTSGTFAATAHNLLSATHGDTTAASAVRGDGIFAIGATPTWQRLAHSTATGGYWKWNGADVVASTNAAAGTGACSNGVVTGENADAAPSCTTADTTTTHAMFATAGAPAFRAIVAGDIPTLNQNTTGSAATLTTPRAIYGNNFDGSASLAQVIAGTYGGSGVNNGSFTETRSGNVTYTGAFNPTFAIPSSSTWTFPSGGGTLLLNNGSAASLTSFPTLNQSTTGTAAGLTAAYVDWSAGSGGASILNKPTIPGASSTTPVMDGTAAIGSAATYAKADHVHPSDTSREPALGNPGTSGYVLASTTGGVRSWVSASGGASSGASGAVQTSNGSGGFVDSGCTASSGAMTCSGGYTSSGAFSGTGAEQSKPSAPASGSGNIWMDNTAHLLQYQGSLGTVIGTMVQPSSSRTANQFVTYINSSGVPQTAALASGDIPNNAANTTGTAAGLAAQYIDWSAGSGGASIANKPATFTAAAHNLLSATHGDTTAASAVRGDGIFAIGATPTWQRLAHSSATGGYWKWNGTDVVASTNAAAGTGACTNGVITAANADAAPTCTTADTTTTHAMFATAGAPAFRAIVAGDIPTLNQNTTGSAAILTTPRAIYGNNFDGSAALNQVIAGTYGGSGVNNGSFTETRSGNVTYTGAFNPTFAIPSSSTWTFPSGGGTLLLNNGSMASLTGLTAAQIPAVPLPTPGTSFTISLPNGFGKCTGTCTVTVPAPTAAGDQFCVWNGVGVSTAITLSAISGVQYSKTDRNAYGTANTAATATAAAGNAVCMVAPDTTHWDVLSSTGTWTMN